MFARNIAAERALCGRGFGQRILLLPAWRKDRLARSRPAVEMPDRLAENLLMFIHQNRGTLPKRRRENEFKALDDKEVRQLEEIVRDAFEGFEESLHIEGNVE